MTQEQIEQYKEVDQKIRAVSDVYQNIENILSADDVFVFFENPKRTTRSSVYSMAINDDLHNILVSEKNKVNKTLQDLKKKLAEI
jgi:hypothetical protein